MSKRRRAAAPGRPAERAVSIAHARADAKHQIRKAVDAVRLADADLLAAVTTARALGLTWGAIADGLGVSRQAANHRFGHLDELTRQPAAPGVTPPGGARDSDAESIAD